jgi:hypothetical protein
MMISNTLNTLFLYLTQLIVVYKAVEQSYAHDWLRSAFETESCSFGSYSWEPLTIVATLTARTSPTLIGSHLSSQRLVFSISYNKTRNKTCYSPGASGAEHQQNLS